MIAKNRKAYFQYFNEVADKLYDVEQIVDSWAGSINWEMDNPFEKIKK